MMLSEDRAFGFRARALHAGTPPDPETGARAQPIHPASTTHQQLTDEDLATAGVRPEMIRVSVGLEDADDLLWDLDRALRKAARSTAVRA